MSQFSGKCDFYDSIISIHCDGNTDKLEEFLANTNIYVRGKDGRNHLVVCRNEKEACKYYPYLVSIGSFNTKEGYNTVILSSESFIDSEEKDFIDWHVRDCLKFWRKCKRNKVVFNIDEYLSTCWSPRSMDLVIAERVAEKGEKATFDGIHNNMHEYFRRKWFEEMVRLGWREYEAFNWCFNEFFPNDKVIEERLGRKINKEN